MIPDRYIVEQKVRDAGREEALSRFCNIGYCFKQDGSVLTEADLAVNQRLFRELTELWPHIAFLSEEMEVAEQEKLVAESDWLWCLDPIDGTSNFASGIPLFAVSLALFHRGEVILGVTYDPIRDELFSAEKGQGAFLNGQNLVSQRSDFRLKESIALIDFKRLPSHLAHTLLKEKPFGSQRNIGSCVLEWCWMAANRGQIYLHGGMKLWDYAAGSLILAEAGGYACTLEGEAVFQQSMDVRSVVMSPDKVLFDQWFAWLQEVYHA